MYEENCEPLPDQDGSAIFAAQLAEIRRNVDLQPPGRVTSDTVIRWGVQANQPHFAAICRRLLLPGSCLRGLQSLEALVKQAANGEACLLCLNHRSNLDVPTLYTLLEDQADPELFRRIIWISGRKLEEDVGMTGLLVQSFNRVVVTPPTWFSSSRSEEQLRQARTINIAAERAVARLRKQGWVIALFPTGTRVRDHDQTTRQAIEATYSYVRAFEKMVLCYIEGCTMPVSRDDDLTRERPMLDRMTYTFGPVLDTRRWLEQVAADDPDVAIRTACARAISREIDALADDA